MRGQFTVVHGIVLAAGASRRMGSPKPLLSYDGSTFLERMLDAFLPVCESVAVVAGPEAHEIRSICENYRVSVVTNPAPERGMLSSLQCALAACTAEGYLFTPVDYPSIAPSTVAAIAGAFRSRMKDVIIPVYEEQGGHPICISAAVAREILALPATGSARQVTRAHAAGTLYLAVEDAGILRDVDTPGDYAALSARGRP